MHLLQKRVSSALMRTKSCPDCKEVKPIVEFGRNRQSVDGLHYYCRHCAAARQRAWTATHPEQVRAMRKNYLQTMHAKNRGIDPYE